MTYLKGDCMITGIIMASGFSTRMGENKLLLPYKKKPIFLHVLDTALESSLNEVLVVTSHKEIFDLVSRRDCKVICNPNPLGGQSQSIYYGVSGADPKSHYMFLSADQPLLTTDILNVLINEFSKDVHSIVVPFVEGERKNPTIFSNDFMSALCQISGDVGGRGIINAMDHLVKEVIFTDTDKTFFMDIDDKEAYKRLLHMENEL